MVCLAFAQPDCTYIKGSTSFAGTGLDFSVTVNTVRAAIGALRTAQPNTRVLLSVGGASYKNFAGLNPTCIKDIIDDLGLDGADIDIEPEMSTLGCQSNDMGAFIGCATDGLSVSVMTAMRATLPKGQYLLSTATFHVGAYGEGAFVDAAPSGSPFRGVNLAMAKSAAGQSLDLVNIMAYDVGNTSMGCGDECTGFDYRDAYLAHRVAWPTQAITIGVEIPPEAW